MSTKDYDLIVVGAGPAGLTAARTAGENGLKVALLERKSDPTAILRPCCMMLLVFNERYFGDYPVFRGGRLIFPLNGFSIPYTGPSVNLYGYYIYSLHKQTIEFGNGAEGRKIGDAAKVAVIHDKSSLLQGLMKEARRYGVEVFPGTNVTDVKMTKSGVEVYGNGRTFRGSFAIAADGVSSRLTSRLGLNKGRTYLGLFLVKALVMKGIQGPDPNVFHQLLFGEPNPCFYSVSPRPRKGEWLVTAISLDPKVDLGQRLDFFMKESPYAPWFKKAKTVGGMAAVEALASPIAEPYRNRVLVIGDAAWTQEAENIGSIMCGWRAAHTVTLALAEGKLDREGVQSYLDWWKRSFVDDYNFADYVKNFNLMYVMDNDDTKVFFDKVKGRYPAQLNAYTNFNLVGARLQQALPQIAVERPTLIPKILGFMMMPIDQLMARSIKAGAFAKPK